MQFDPLQHTSHHPRLATIFTLNFSEKTKLNLHLKYLYRNNWYTAIKNEYGHCESDILRWLDWVLVVTLNEKKYRSAENSQRNNIRDAQNLVKRKDRINRLNFTRK